MTGIDPLLTIALSALAAVIVVGVLKARRLVDLRRVRSYFDGIIPEVLDFGAEWFGLSTDSGPLIREKGAIMATRDSLVFLGRKSHARLELPWQNISGWSVAERLRSRPLDRKSLSVQFREESGVLVETAMSVPRPAFWARLIDMSGKQEAQR